MAEKVKIDNKIKKMDSSKPEKPKKRVGLILKMLLIGVILLIVAGAGFALGIYLKIFDIEGLTKSLKLNEYPVIGQYFSQPKTNFEPVELEQENAELALTPASSQVVPPVVMTDVPMVKGKVDDTELQKQAKIKQQEEAKRISKLARLYGGMKPDEAVVILNNLDDNTVLDILSKMEDEQVSKIMALLNPSRAANLTQAMLRGKNIN